MNKKLTAIFAILMVALMLAGISYALWSKTLYIFGDVYAGNLDAEFTYWFSNDPPGHYPDPPLPGIPYGNDPGYTKDVGWVICYIDSIDPQIAYVEIHNGYPSYYVHYSATIMNTGDVPWILKEYKINGEVIPENQWFPVDLDGDGDPDIEFYITDSIGEQREPGESVETSIDTHILQLAHEDFIYDTFEFTFTVVQWNEYP